LTECEIYIAVGSNVEPERHIPEAVAALAEAFGPLVRSPAYRSAAIGFAGPDFVNCVVRGQTGRAPEFVVQHLKALEASSGRRRDGAVGSRELDLDLVLYGDEVISDPGFELPRPDVLRYAFVLRPLVEIAPDFVHPVTGRTLAWHWEHFNGERITLEPEALEGAARSA
jgi:2-amino-4-hydroxy-6-hydroxymethyldihydropteridine diphosphokinase